MITDERQGQPKAFELMQHENHKENPNRLEVKLCQRCRFDTAEKSLTDKIKELTPNSEIKDNKNKILKIKSLAVKRGNLDDCMGWRILWS